MFGLNKYISNEELNKLIDDKEAVIIDVRETREYSQGHIPSAINIPLSLLPLKIEDAVPNRDTKIVVYCLSGGRSSQAKVLLKSKKYTDVLNFGGVGRYEGTLEQ